LANEYFWLLGGIGFVAYAFYIENDCPNHRRLSEKYAARRLVMLLGSGVVYLTEKQLA